MWLCFLCGGDVVDFLSSTFTFAVHLTKDLILTYISPAVLQSLNFRENTQTFTSSSDHRKKHQP
jgi:hypothetical protein